MQVSVWSAQLRDYDSHNYKNRHRFWDEEITGNSLVNTLAPVIGLWTRPTQRRRQRPHSRAEHVTICSFELCTVPAHYAARFR